MTLEEYRRLNGLTLKGLGALLGINGEHAARTVQRYCAFERIPSRSDLRKIADVTGGVVRDQDFPDRPIRARHHAPSVSP